ncbi:hypothetical protein HDZ31DRAFT_75989 [Schizophyllum fasciatum]
MLGLLPARPARSARTHLTPPRPEKLKIPIAYTHPNKCLRRYSPKSRIHWHISSSNISPKAEPQLARSQTFIPLIARSLNGLWTFTSTQPPTDSNPKPTLAPKPLLRKGKNTFLGPLNLPSASLPLPTPLSSGSINNDHPLLPSINLSDTVTQQTDTPTLPAPPKSPPAAPQLPQSAPASPASDIESEDETMSPIITIAPGITVASQGKAPCFEGTTKMEKSLAALSTCTSVVDKVCAWALAQVLEDGKFMQWLLPYFETCKMVNKISCTISEHLWTLEDLTFDQLETVFHNTYVIGGQAAFLKTFRTFKHIYGETPLEFYNRVDGMNFNIPASEMSTTQEIIMRVSENFPEDFAEFCEHNDAFATLATYQLPKVVDGDAASLASY